jgi:hypothetical protein
MVFVEDDRQVGEEVARSGEIGWREATAPVGDKQGVGDVNGPQAWDVGRVLVQQLQNTIGEFDCSSRRHHDTEIDASTTKGI